MNYKPQRTKYAKSHKGRLSSIPKICSLAFGRYGLVAREPCRLKASHLAAAELAIKRKFKREAKVWLRVFPHLPVTRKPAEVRMGKGKGNVDFWMARVRPGNILLEITSPNATLAKIVLETASSKLPLKTSFISK